MRDYTTMPTQDLYREAMSIHRYMKRMLRRDLHFFEEVMTLVHLDRSARPWEEFEAAWAEWLVRRCKTIEVRMKEVHRD